MMSMTGFASGRVFRNPAPGAARIALWFVAAFGFSLAPAVHDAAWSPLTLLNGHTKSQPGSWDHAGTRRRVSLADPRATADGGGGSGAWGRPVRTRPAPANPRCRGAKLRRQRTVVGEAMSRLKADGVVQTRQGVGAFVASDRQSGRARCAAGAVRAAYGGRTEAASLAARRRAEPRLAGIRAAQWTKIWASTGHCSRDRQSAAYAVHPPF
jgi:hypothetical protein